MGEPRDDQAEPGRAHERQRAAATQTITQRAGRSASAAGARVRSTAARARAGGPASRGCSGCENTRTASPASMPMLPNSVASSQDWSQVGSPSCAARSRRPRPPACRRAGPSAACSPAASVRSPTPEHGGRDGGQVGDERVRSPSCGPATSPSGRPIAKPPATASRMRRMTRRHVEAQQLEAGDRARGEERRQRQGVVLHVAGHEPQHAPQPGRDEPEGEQRDDPPLAVVLVEGDHQGDERERAWRPGPRPSARQPTRSAAAPPDYERPTRGRRAGSSARAVPADRRRQISSATAPPLGRRAGRRPAAERRDGALRRRPASPARGPSSRKRRGGGRAGFAHALQCARGRAAARRGRRAHASGSLRRQRSAGYAVVDQLGPGPDVAHQRRRAQRHALHRDQPEGLLPGGQQGQVERAQDLGHVVALPEEVHGVAHAELADQRARASAGTRGCRSARPCRRRRRRRPASRWASTPARRSSASARIATSCPFHGVICATWPRSAALRAEAELLAQRRRADPPRVEAGVVDAVVDARGHGRGEALVEAARPCSPRRPRPPRRCAPQHASAPRGRCG